MLLRPKLIGLMPGGSLVGPRAPPAPRPPLMAAIMADSRSPASRSYSRWRASRSAKDISCSRSSIPPEPGRCMTPPWWSEDRRGLLLNHAALGRAQQQGALIEDIGDGPERERAWRSASLGCGLPPWRPKGEHQPIQAEERGS